MIKSRLTFLDPVLLARLRKFNSIKTRLRTRLQAMQAADAVAAPPRKGVKANGDHELVVASYNIHKCVGTDGRFEPARIAAVIAEMDADVVAVQEADKRFGRRHGLLDIKALEKQTGLSLIPTSEEANGHGWHGNALLLRKGKVRDMRRLALPGAEPRGALVVDLDLPGRAAEARRRASRPVAPQPPLAGALDPRRDRAGAAHAHPACRRPQRMAAGPEVVAA